jgi:endonuclease VIII-like 1
MPELAELRLSADYINEQSVGKTFYRIRKSPQHKGVELGTPYNEFTLSATSRGKELLITVYDKNSPDTKSIVMGLGMVGQFVITETGKSPRFAHLMFDTTDGYTLNFVDMRRFGRWAWGTWKDDRSPDPTTEYNAFVKNIYDNIDKAAFNKPIYELLMNQKYCNGIGNYLRAEILGRIDSNPFVPARDYIQQNPEVLDLCREIPINSYKYKKEKGLNYDGKEPYLKYYKKDTSLSIEDKGKRVFWYDAKWGKQ